MDEIRHPGLFASGADAYRTEKKVDLLQHTVDQIVRHMGVIIEGEALILRQEIRTMTTLQEALAKEQTALAAIRANTDRLPAIKQALDAKDAALADITAQLKAALADGADPAVLQQIADTGDAILAASNTQATAEAALENTTATGGTPTGDATTITSINPNNGLAGTTISVVGTGFIGAGVVFGGTPVDPGSVTITNDSNLTFVAPAGTGQTSVTVNSPTGSVSNPAVFNFA